MNRTPSTETLIDWPVVMDAMTPRTAPTVRISRDTLRTLCTVAAVVTRHLRDAGLPLSWDDGIDAAVSDATAALGKARR